MISVRTIKGRLITLLLGLGVLLVISVIFGQFALSRSNASLKSVYEDRVVPLSQFMAMRDAYDKLIDASRSARDKSLDPIEAAQRLESDRARIHREWDAYLTTYLTPAEKVLAAEMQIQIDENDGLVASAVKELRGRRMDNYGATHLALNRMMVGTGETMAKLTTLQLKETEDEFGRAQAAASEARIVLIGCLVVAGAALLCGLYTILSGVTRPLDRTTAMMARLAAGDLSVTVVGAERRDEIGAVVRAVEVFKDAMVAKRAADEAAALENEAKTRRAQLLDRITQAFEAQVSGLTQTLSSAATEMEATAQSMTGAAARTTDQSDGVASAAERT